MTNEELALKIQAGEVELMSELWLQVDKFVRLRAYNFASGQAWSERCRAVGITQDDLYCVGYFALEPAVKSYDPEKGAFITIFGYYLKRTFINEIGMHKSGGKWYEKPDAISSAVSLQETASTGKDGDELSLEAMIEDEQAQKPFDDIEDALYNQALHNDLEAALDGLRPRDAQVIRDHYYNLLSPDEQAQKLGVSRSTVNSIRTRALLLLRKHARLQAYRSRFLNSTALTGFKAWKETGMSQQERFIIKLEEYEEKLGLK